MFDLGEEPPKRKNGLIMDLEIKVGPMRVLLNITILVRNLENIVVSVRG